jgi:hypothetical protein
MGTAIDFDIERPLRVPRGEKNKGQVKHILSGRTFGFLRVVGFYGRRYGQPHWRCYCDPGLGGCGGYTVVSTWNLLRPEQPHSRSCGCVKKSFLRKRQDIIRRAEAGQLVTL